MVTLLLLAFNIWCCFQVEQKFDPIWYLNPDSYPMQYAEALKLHFPKHGKRSAIYIGKKLIKRKNFLYDIVIFRCDKFMIYFFSQVKLTTLPNEII